MKLVRIGVTALLLCLVFACNDAAKREVATADIKEVSQSNDKGEEAAGNTRQNTPAPPPGNNKQQQNPQQPNTPTTVNMDWEKKIIKNADLNLEVTDYNAYNQQVHASVKQWGGYIAQETQQSSEYKKENTIAIKVPVDQFDNIVQSLTSGKEKILVNKITSEDVTGEVVDTRARMEAKRQIRQRYMDLLKQARNMEEILRVQNVIDDIQLQIESATGRINYLTHASAFSTIHLTFFQVIDASAVDLKEPTFGQRVLDSLKNGMSWMGELLLLMLNLWPLALLGAIIYWGFKKWRPAKVKANH
jgi:hypothetical protein